MGVRIVILPWSQNGGELIPLTKYDVLMENFLLSAFYITHKESNVSFPFPARVIWEPYFKFALLSDYLHF